MSIEKQSGTKEYISILWQKFTEGDHEAFSQLYLYFRPRLLHYGLKIHPAPELIEDCIQDLFYQLYFLGEKQHDIENITVYVFISLRRKILRTLHIQRRFQSVSHNPEIFETAITFSPEDMIISSEHERLKATGLTAILNHLSPRQREIVYLRYYNGLDNREIAGVLGISYQVVQNVIYKAFKKLRNAYPKQQINNFFP